MNAAAHRLFGLVLDSELPITTPLASAIGPPDLRLVERQAPLPAPLPEPFFTSRISTAAGESVVLAFQLPEGDLLRFAEVGDFLLSTDRIEVRPASERGRFAIEAHLLGPVLAYWLERSGVPCLHAAAVAVGGRAAGFLGTSGSGKSSLASELVASGQPLVTDDVLAVDVVPDGPATARPAFPQLRLWPEEAERRWGPVESFPRVHPEAAKVRVPLPPDLFTPYPVPLARLYLPERRDADDGPVTIEPVSPRDAVIELVRHSFVGRLVEAAGWGARRFDLLARIAEAVPLARLSYPSGHAHLPCVREAVLADLGARV